MICEDGRLGLVDYGNAPIIPLSTRIKLAKFILALDSGDDQKIVEALKNLGAKTKNNNTKLLLSFALCNFDQQYDNPEVRKKLGIDEEITNDEAAILKFFYF